MSKSFLKKLTTTILMLLVIVSGFTLAPKTADAAWYNTSWTYRFSVTVQNGKVDADLTDFPVYLNLADLGTDHNFWSHVNSDGSDIRITTSDGTTEVPREVATSTFSTSSKTGAVYFKAPSLADASDTVFYVYYGNAGATEPNANATYGKFNAWNSNYKAVYHLDEDVNTSTGGYTDSTSNGNHMTGTSMADAATAGQLAGKAASFDGSADYLSRASAVVSSAPLTISAWINTDDVANPKTITSIARTSVQNDEFRLQMQGNATGDPIRYFVATAGSFADFGESTTGLSGSTNTWFFATGRSNSAASWDAFLNGGNKGNDTGSRTPASLAVTNIGRYQNTGNGNYWDGEIDEVRISDVALTDTWISTEYNNQSSSSTFYSVSDEETDSSGSSGASRIIRLWGIRFGSGVRLTP